VAKDDVKLTAKGAGIRQPKLPCNYGTNALSVKLRGSHTPLLTTRVPPPVWRQATGEAEEWGEVLVTDQASVLE
jgi:hypothetical protein